MLTYSRTSKLAWYLNYCVFNISIPVQFPPFQNTFLFGLVHWCKYLKQDVMALFQFLGHLYTKLQTLLLLRDELDASLHQTMSKKSGKKKKRKCLKQNVFNLHYSKTSFQHWNNLSMVEMINVPGFVTNTKIITVQAK